MRVESPAFRSEDTIPVKYTCDGDDVSPPLRWLEVPAGVKSFVLIMEDLMHQAEPSRTGSYTTYHLT